MEEKLVKISKLISSEYAEYKIGDLVWHVTNTDLSRGVIINWRLFGNDGSIDYVVSFGPGEIFTLASAELSMDKPIL